MRRIEALTGQGVLEYYSHMEETLNAAAAAAKCEPSQLVKRIEGLHEEIKELGRENDKLKNQMAKDAMGDVMDKVAEVSGVSLLTLEVANMDMNGLRNLGDQLKSKLGEGVVVLASAAEGKVNLIATATDGAMAKGAHAGNLIKAIASLVGGGGGGRPNMAQAGGKNPEGIAKALEAAKAALEKQIH